MAVERALWAYSCGHLFPIIFTSFGFRCRSSRFRTRCQTQEPFLGTRAACNLMLALAVESCLVTVDCGHPRLLRVFVLCAAPGRLKKTLRTMFKMWQAC